MLNFLRHTSHAKLYTIGGLLLTTLLAGSQSWAKSDDSYKKYLSLYKRPKDIPYPKENAHSPAREELGKTLFFDPRLSASGNLACVSCHTPALSWGDGLAKAVGFGAKEAGRRSPTLLNLAWVAIVPWDGRSGSIDDQAAGPVALPGVMNLPHEKMIERLTKIPGYQEMFTKAYPGEGITKATTSKALATFERSLVSGTAPFDRWVSGDSKAVPEAAKRGFLTFNTKGNCSQCHSGWRFTDDGFYDIGLPGEDIGRGKFLPDIASAQHAFKVPTLRNADHRGPYMHDGSVESLEKVIALYNRGGDVKRPSLAEHIKPLELTADEQLDMLAFLKTLTSKDKATTIPVLPR